MVKLAFKIKAILMIILKCHARHKKIIKGIVFKELFKQYWLLEVIIRTKENIAPKKLM